MGERWGPWATLAWAVGCGFVMVATQTAGAVTFLLWWRQIHPEQPIHIQDLGSNGSALAFTLLVSTPFVLAFVALAVRFARADLADYLALKWPRSRDIGVGVAALGAVLLLAGVAEQISGQEDPSFLFDTFGTAQSAGLLPLMFVAFVVLAPLQEEILFRGFLYRGLAPALGPAPTIALVSALWAVLHVQYAWFFIAEIFALGLTFGWLRYRSGSTLLTVILHVTNNALAMLLAGLMPS
jgi:membrane protease YdiL (CAAX protease family)